MILIDGIEWRPISFVDQLVEAILADLKWETRRIARIDWQWGFPPAQYRDGYIYRWGAAAANDAKPERVVCPYGKAGDRLWVRESFFAIDKHLDPCRIDEATGIVFRDGICKLKCGEFLTSNIMLTGKEKFRPPMHLPHWAHRIELEVKSIKVERLQEITEAAAVAEGFAADDPSEDRSERTFNRLICPQCGGLGIYPANSIGGAIFDADCKLCESARGKFQIKWDQINGKRKDKNSGKPLVWDNNPIVWVVNFKRINACPECGGETYRTGGICKECRWSC